MEETSYAPSGRRTFALLLTIHTCSAIGSNITLVALPWFVLQLTGSATLTGLSGGALALAAITAGVFGGVLVDRFGYKSTSLFGDGFSALSIALVPVLYAMTDVNFLLALVLIFFARLLDVPVVTARRAMIPEIATRADVPLERINSWFESGTHVASLAGPVSAGLLITFLGPANVFLVSAALLALASVTTWILLPADDAVAPIPTDEKPPRTQHFITDFVEGIQFIRGHRLLLGLLIALGLVNMITFPIFGVVLPVYADTVLQSASELGVLLSVWGGGVLAGTLVYSAIGDRFQRRWIWLTAIALLTLPVGGMLFGMGLFGLIPLLIIAAFIYGPLNPIMVTVRHERAPTALRGRVFATFSAVGMACAPAGNMLAGTSIDIFGMTATLAGFVALLAAFVIVVSLMPVFRQMERHDEAPGTG